MFKVLYRCNPTIERHTNSPLADSTRLCLVSSIKAVATPSAWLCESETFLESLKVLDVSARVRIWGTTWLGS